MIEVQMENGLHFPKKHEKNEFLYLWALDNGLWEVKGDVRPVKTLLSTRYVPLYIK